MDATELKPAYLALPSKPHDHLYTIYYCLNPSHNYIEPALYHTLTSLGAKKVLGPLHMNPSKKVPNTPAINLPPYKHSIQGLTYSNRCYRSLKALYIYYDISGYKSPSPQPMECVYLPPKSLEFIKSAASP